MSPSSAAAGGSASTAHPQPENYHIVEGDGLLAVNATQHHVGPGDSIFIPGNAPHGIRNIGRSRLRFIYTFAVDSLADVQYEWL